MHADPEETELTKAHRAMAEKIERLEKEKVRLLNLIDDAVRDLWRPATYRSREEIAQFLVDVLAEGWSSHNATLAPKLATEDDDEGI